MASARGATLLAPDRLEISEYPLPDIPPDGGLVNVEMTISASTLEKVAGVVKQQK